MYVQSFQTRGLKAPIKYNNKVGTCASASIMIIIHVKEVWTDQVGQAQMKCADDFVLVLFLIFALF